MVDSKYKGLTPSEMEAWCEWRKWCSIWRVESPHPTQEEIEDGKTDDKTLEERREYFEYLRKKVVNAFIYRLRQFHRFQAPAENEIISVFDDYMNGEKKEQTEAFTSGSYKDYLFFLIASGGNFSGVIQGKIFTPVTGYIREIIKQYIFDNYGCVTGPRGGKQNVVWDEDEKKKKAKIVIPKSLDALLLSENAPEGSSLKDVISDGRDGLPSETYDFTEFLSILSREEKIVTLAKTYKMPMSSDAVLNFMHCKKSKSTELGNKLFPETRHPDRYPDSLFSKLANSGFRDALICDTTFTEQLKNAIILDLSAEKEFDSFLSALKEDKGVEE